MTIPVTWFFVGLLLFLFVVVVLGVGWGGDVFVVVVVLFVSFYKKAYVTGSD